MNLSESLETAMASAKNNKERAVGRAERHSDPVITCIRGEEVIAMVVVALAGDEFLRVASVCATGYRPDIMTVAVDTYQAHERPPRPGELNDLADNHDGIARGLVFEALVVLAANRAGDVLVASAPYQVSGREVTWVDPLNDGKALCCSGCMTDSLRRMMEAPTVDVEMLKLNAFPGGFGLSPEQAAVHTDIATTKLLQGRRWGHVALPCEKGGYRAAAISRAFPGAPVGRIGVSE